VKVIGICGKKRHGKDTVGGFLSAEFDYTPIAFADPIKRIAMDLYDFSYEQVYGSEKEIPDERWDGLTPRHAMQQIGTEVARLIHPLTWVRKCLANIREYQTGESHPILHSPAHRDFRPAHGSWIPDRNLWVICDVRFPNEAEAIRAEGGKVIKVVRPSLEGKQGDAHASETNIDKIDPDILVVNDGTLEDLALKARGLGKELR
jgi:hypothetical protein